MPVIHLPDDTTGSLLVINERRLQLVLVLTEDSRLVSDVAVRPQPFFEKRPFVSGLLSSPGREWEVQLPCD